MRRLPPLLVIVALGCAAWGFVWLTGGLPPASSPIGQSDPAARRPRISPIAGASESQAAAPRSCEEPPELAGAASSNAASLTGVQWSVFGRPETGWSVYVPLVSKEVSTTCPPDRSDFAYALQIWQRTHGLPSTGVMTADTLRTMNLLWLGRRPFVAATHNGACPPPPPNDALVDARPDEGRRGKLVRVHAEALAAYRRLVAAARAASSDIASDPQLLTIVSGFRGPSEEAAKCAVPGSCGTPSVARCSAHRTGLAFDLFLGPTTGSNSTSSDDASRTLQSRSAAYGWLVANAGQFGFTPYPFEPWHWEYTRPLSVRSQPPRD